MEENDKTYMWLVIITFFGLAIAIAFSLMELSELQATDLFTSSNPFSG